MPCSGSGLCHRMPPALISVQHLSEITDHFHPVLHFKMNSLATCCWCIHAALTLCYTAVKSLSVNVQLLSVLILSFPPHRSQCTTSHLASTLPQTVHSTGPPQSSTARIGTSRFRRTDPNRQVHEPTSKTTHGAGGWQKTLFKFFQSF